MYQTRCVFQLPLHRAGDVASYVAKVLQASGIEPTSVSINADETTATATVCYTTNTTTESDRCIGAWRQIDQRIQVERNHRINPDKFRNIAMMGTDNRQLRNLLANEVERLCRKGVGSKGVLDYLTECEGIVAELRAYVESVRAQV